MFREIILPIFRSTRLCVTACGIMHPPRYCRPKAGNIVRSAPPPTQRMFPAYSDDLLCHELHTVGCLFCIAFFGGFHLTHPDIQQTQSYDINASLDHVWHVYQSLQAISALWPVHSGTSSIISVGMGNAQVVTLKVLGNVLESVMYV